uniref:Uncharacterized protein n=1 Tax=Tanacetum cinerariifolium TaxID=118510 RepID=A0A6L2MDZ7_TANCI|nr:hypothetical protein [Tanacetum cinerariifolium]
MHKVPIVAYSKDGLSLIAIQIGTSIMLDAFTSSMCVDSCGRIGFVRPLIEVGADKELKHEVTMVVLIVDATKKAGFETIDYTKEKIRVEYEWKPSFNKPKTTFVYRPKQPQPTVAKPLVDEPINLAKLKNQFDVLRDQDDLLREVNVSESSGGTEKYNMNKKDASYGSDSKSKVEELVLEGNPNVSDEWTSNAILCFKHCRIIVGWNVDVVHLMVLSQSSQALHVKVFHKATNKTMFCSFIYADFNIALNMEDSYAGSSSFNSAMCEFKDFVTRIEVMDINSFGLHYTWNQKPKGECDSYLYDEESVYLKAFNEDKLDEEWFLKQKAKIDWLEAGDSNSSYFISLSSLEANEVELKLWLIQITLKFWAPMYQRCCKILYIRIIEGIKEVVSDNQAAFVSGRQISNILITQELMHSCHKNHGPPRCMFKVDIQKAYDTVDWRFLEIILVRFRFHCTMVKWIMACVTSTSFSLNINGNIHGFFKRKKGFEIRRSSFPLSFHYGYGDFNAYSQKTNDLFIFAHGELALARVILESLDEFKWFWVLELPVKYIGVPLISSRLLNKDYKILVEKAKNRIRDWKNKSLSFAGRLQLCKSTISSMHVYWTSVLMIPKGIIYDIYQLIRGFLWCNGEYKRGKAKVAWDDICLPKEEGGLGLRSLDVFNIALMTTHIWNIVSNKESLWVRWIHTYKLRGYKLEDKLNSSNHLLRIEAEIKSPWHNITRIDVGWDPLVIFAKVLSQTDQAMHLLINSFRDNKQIFVSIIYGKNTPDARVKLWKSLIEHEGVAGNDPWVTLGDFNVVLRVNENSNGHNVRGVGIKDFRDCVDRLELEDINMTGKYPDSFDVFMPYMTSDHSYVVLTIPDLADIDVKGYEMFKLAKKLKNMKKHMRQMNRRNGNVYEKVMVLKEELFRIQQSLDKDPSNALLREEEMVYYHAYREATLDEEKLLKQKTKIEWLRETASFSVCVNEDSRGFFKAKMGLRQGDLISPYLFTLLMEVLNLMVKRYLVLGQGFIPEEMLK